MVTLSSVASSVSSSRLGVGLEVASGSGVWDDGRRLSGGLMADEPTERLNLDMSCSNGESFVGEMDRARSVWCRSTLEG